MGTTNTMLSIEVVYASVTAQKVIALSVKEGATIQEAIEQSGILSSFPEIDLTQQKVGVFGKRKVLSDIVQDNERIEIYRPLVIDPKEARRAKAKRQKKKQ